MLGTLKSILRPILPDRIRKPAARWLWRQTTAGTRKELRRLLATPHLHMAVYDDRLDILRFVSLAGEMLYIAQRGEIADAVPWMGRLDRFVPKGGVILDVGGFRGVTAQWFAHRSREVHVFEPNPQSARSIEQMISVRKITNIHLHKFAVCDQEGTSEFHVQPRPGRSSLGDTKAASTKVIEVPTSTLDRFLTSREIENVTFLKIDVEGFEFEVLNGARRALSAGKIGNVLFENNKTVMGDLGRTVEPVYHLLTECGFELLNLDGQAVSLARMLEGSPADVLAVHKRSART